MATMKQIANLAGVSLGTVDRVLNSRGSVNADTAKRIMDIVHSLDYIPNKTARCLSIRKLNLKIGCIILSSELNAVYAQIEAGVLKKAAELEDYNISIILKHIDHTNPESQNELIDELVDEKVQGIVFCGFNLPETVRKIDLLAARGIPVITMAVDLPDSRRVAYVGSDFKKGGRVAAQLISLISGESSRVGIIFYGLQNNLNYVERVDGFKEYIKENAPGIVIAAHEPNFNDDFISYSLVDSLLRKTPAIDTFLIVSGGIYGACKAIERAPADNRPKVVCFNCIPSTRDMMKKGIISATISPNTEYQGMKPLDLMFNLLCFNVRPSRELYHVNMDIIISESLTD